MNFSTSFSPPLLLRRGDQRAAKWASDSQPRSSLQKNNRYRKPRGARWWVVNTCKEKASSYIPKENISSKNAVGFNCTANANCSGGHPDYYTELTQAGSSLPRKNKIEYTNSTAEANNPTLNHGPSFSPPVFQFLCQLHLGSLCDWLSHSIHKLSHP